MDKSIASYTQDELCDLMVSWGQPRFRGKQLYEWVHAHRAASYDDMSNLPKALRERLAAELPLQGPQVVDVQASADGTRKYVLEMPDGARAETVAIPSVAKDGSTRLTVCFSTQAGCPMECAFCATGTQPLERSLMAGEMTAQVHLVQEDFDQRVSNVVAMGQGEPFLNYEELLKALRMMNDPAELGIGARHITVSTCGLVDGIERFAQEPEQFTLAVSLHSAEQPVRNRLMPQLANQQLGKLRAALLDYVETSGRRVSLEYLLLDGINDTEQVLDELMRFCSGLHCHINLIPFNESNGISFKAASKERLRDWRDRLETAGISATVRSSRGSDIAGACGQLKNQLR